MLIKRTKSVCPVCLELLDAEICVGKDSNIYIKKHCERHGSFEVLIWESDLASYMRWNKSSSTVEAPVEPCKESKGCPYDCGLCEKHLRKGCCMLLELTTRCNLHCPICFASAGENEGRDLSIEEIASQYDYLMSHGGPFNIQLSGGEPTVRDDLPEIIQLGREKGFTFFQLNTNGLRLAKERGYAKKLADAGLNTVFLQFDALSDTVYTTLRGRELLDDKLKAIENCAEAGLGIVLVPVIAAGINEDQVGEILSFAMSNMPHIRGVHFQPLSYFGRCSLERPQKPVTIPRMLSLIEQQTDGKMKAVDFAGGGAENPYCSFHASYIKKSDGTLKALEQKNSGSCCCSTSSADSMEYVAKQWNGNSTFCFAVDDSMSETSALDEFLAKARESTLAVSGMLFQDAFNLDLDRLKRCYICELDGEYGMVPFCAYNLTDTNGRALYRK